MGGAGLEEGDLATDTFDEERYGSNESMHNKIYNQYSPAELDYLLKETQDQFGLHEDGQGGYLQRNEEGELAPFTGNSAEYGTVYQYGTKDGEGYKLGAWGGLDPDVRYNERVLESYGEQVGEKGVDLDQRQAAYRLPINMVYALEGLVHGSDQMVDNRAVRMTDDITLDEYRQQRDLYGSGASEYYNNFELAELDQDTKEKIWSEFTERFRPETDNRITRAELAERFRNEGTDNTYREELAAQYREQYGLEDKGGNIGFINRSINSAASIVPSFVRPLLIEPAAWIGEMALHNVEDGDKIHEEWFGTEDSRKAYWDELFGYDSGYSERAMDEVGEHAQKIYTEFTENGNVDFGSALSALGRIARTPELWNESIGHIMALGVGFGKFTKVGKAIQDTEKAYRAGNITKAAAKTEVKDIKKAADFGEKAQYLASKNVGFTSVLGGNVNNSLDEFAENNNGEWTMLDAARITAVEAAAMALDRVSGSIVLRDLPGVRSIDHKFFSATRMGYDKKSAEIIKDIAKEANPEQYAKMYRSVKTMAAFVGKGVGKGTESAVTEGATEYVQSLLEVFNVKYGTEKYGDGMLDILMAEDTQVEAITGGLVGTGTGPAMTAQSSVLSNATRPLDVIRARNLDRKSPDEEDISEVGQVKDDGTVMSPAEVAAKGVQEGSFSESFDRVNEAYNNKTANEENIEGLLNDITNIRSYLSDTASSMSEEDYQRLEGKVDGIESSIQAQYLENTQGKATIRTEDPAVKEELSEDDSRTPYDYAEGEAGDVYEDYSPFELAAEGEEVTETTIRERKQKTKDIAEEATDSSTLDPVAEAVREAQERQEAIRNATYTPAQATLKAEEMIENYITVNEGNLSDEQKTTLENFARNNRVDESLVEKLVASYATVNQEAWDEKRGVNTRQRNLKAALAADKPDPKQVQRMYDEGVSYMTATMSSLEALKKGIRDAERLADNLNHPNNPKSSGTTQQHTTEYLKKDKKPFVINITRDKEDGQWRADTRIAQKNIDEKQKVLDGLNSMINFAHANAGHILDADKIVTYGAYNVPAPSKPSQAHKAEINYLEDVKQILRESGHEFVEANKLILGESVRGYWKKGSNRRRLNSGITNVKDNSGKEYTEDDVVVLHEEGYFNGKGGKVSTLYTKNSVAGAEAKAATKAGATIILDNPHKVYSGESYKNSPGYRNAKFLTDQGYMQKSPYGAGRSIFVPKTPEAEAYYEAQKEDRAASRQAKKEETAAKDKAVDLAQELEAVQRGMDSTRTEAEIQAELDTAKQDLEQYFTRQAVDQLQREVRQAEAEQQLATEQVDEGPTAVNPGDVGLTQKEIDEISEDHSLELGEAVEDRVVGLDQVSDKVEENIQNFLDNQVSKAVKEAAEAETLRTDDTVPTEYTPHLKHLIRQEMEQSRQASAKADQITGIWGTLSALRLSPRDFKKRLTEELRRLGIMGDDKQDGFQLGQVTKNIMKKAFGSTLQQTYYSVVTADFNDDGSIAKRYVYTRFKKVDSMKIGAELKNATRGVSGKKQSIISINKLSPNPSKFLRTSRDTPYGTIPVSELPSVFKSVSDKSLKAMQKLFPALTKDELTLDEGFQGQEKPGIFLLVDSPARALIYQEDGSIDPNIALAVGASVRDLAKRNKFKMKLGHKDNATIAAMFGIREEEVTQEHKKFAKEHGMLMKTAADSLGRSILSSLGLSKKRATELTRGHFERLVSDLGEMALEVAREEGYLEYTEVPTNTLANLYRDGEIRAEGNTTNTTFVNLKTTKGKKQVVTKEVDKTIIEHDKMDEYIPDALNTSKGPRIGKIESDDAKQNREAEIEEASSKVRNDSVGAVPPAEAKTMIRNLMETPYNINLETTKEFLDIVLSEDPEVSAGIMRQLGYIEIDPENPEYSNMLKSQKDIQESINDAIEKDIEALRKIYETVEKLPNDERQMWFDFFYSSNHRFNLDSNTVNPQGSKIHRFLITPEGQDITYSIDKKTNTFTYNYTMKDGTKGSIDSSLYVRIALSQAFGVGVDKIFTTNNGERVDGKLANVEGISEDIVSIGNALLSLDKKGIAAVKAAVLGTGEFTIEASDGTKMDFEVDHITHALQAINFLEKYQEADGTFTHDLTAEFDALTSGYGNKIQQFGLIDNLPEHASRVGVIRKDSGRQGAFKQGDKKNSPVATYGVNDMLAEPDMVDSYQNLAKRTIANVVATVQDLKGNAHDVFSGIKDLLPGYSLTSLPEGEYQIDGALRNLFKPPFMIFNYAATVNRIVKDLGNEMAISVLETIAKGDYDLKDDTAPEVVAMDKLRKYVSLEGKIPSREAFVNLLRNEDVDNIKMVWEVSGSRGQKSTKKQNLVDFMSAEVIAPTYGKAVQTTFETEFSDFIKIQEVTIDTFKQAFAVFNHLLMDKVQSFRIGTRDKDGNVITEPKTQITEEDMQGMITDLMDVFPAIAGPLSDAIESGEGIYIYDTTTNTPDGPMSTVPPAQTRLATGKQQSKTVRPILKALTAAANSGAVIPFHAIDGAQLATAFNSVTEHLFGNLEGMEGKGATMLPLHDAYTAGLPFMDMVARAYNQNTVVLHETYSILGEIVNLNNKIKDIVNGEHPKYKLDVGKMEPVRGLAIQRSDEQGIKLKYEALKNAEESLRDAKKSGNKNAIARAETAKAEAKAELSFASEFNANTIILEGIKERVDDVRETMYEEGTIVSSMVGTEGGMYRVEGKETKMADKESIFDPTPNEYHKRLVPDYRKSDVTVIYEGEATNNKKPNPEREVDINVLDKTDDVLNLESKNFPNVEIDNQAMPSATHLILDPTGQREGSKLKTLGYRYDRKRAGKTNRDSVAYVVMPPLKNKKPKQEYIDGLADKVLSALNRGASVILSNETSQALLDTINSSEKFEDMTQAERTIEAPVSGKEHVFTVMTSGKVEEYVPQFEGAGIPGLGSTTANTKKNVPSKQNEPAITPEAEDILGTKPVSDDLKDTTHNHNQKKKGCQE